MEIRNLRSKAKRREERFIHHLPPAADEDIGGWVRTMNKLKIAGSIIMMAAAVVFLILFFGKHVNSIGYALLIVGVAFGVAVGAAMVAASEELNLEDFEDEK